MENMYHTKIKLYSTVYLKELHIEDCQLLTAKCRNCLFVEDWTLLDASLHLLPSNKETESDAYYIQGACYHHW